MHQCLPPRRYLAAVSVAAALAAASCGDSTHAARTEIVEYGYEVCDEHPHDAEAFTQGLLFVGDRLFESTGREGLSDLREVDLDTGQVQRRVALDEALFDLSFPREPFGEGLAALDDRLIQLTWLNHRAFVWDRDTFEPIESFSISNDEAWGLTYDGRRLILSDGTDQLTFLDPDTYEVLGQVAVTDERGAVERLNELEYIDGRVWANVWLTDTIVIIDPDSGAVTGRVDLSGLLERIAPAERPTDPDAVLNGIAARDSSDCVAVTGKLWPLIFEVRPVVR